VSASKKVNCHVQHCLAHIPRQDSEAINNCGSFTTFDVKGPHLNIFWWAVWGCIVGAATEGSKSC
jgi:hypothetical protein